jgi:SagB-type dehydrogenase family enzyme
MLTHEDRPSAIKLPPPVLKGEASVEETLARRRSVRRYGTKALPLRSISQILWAAQGITDPDGVFRTAPSAGAIYPLELYVVVRKDGVEGLSEGVYHYQPSGHALELVREGDFSADLEAGTWGQEIVKAAAASVVMTGVLGRIAEKYGRRGSQYMYQESGHAAQNAFLQATALGIGSVVMGAFSEAAVRRVVGARVGERPLYIQPLGIP